VAAADFVRFLVAMRDDPDRLARYDKFSQPQLLFHAQNEGFRFDAADAENVVGTLEYVLITDKDGEAFDGNSRLWRYMWGKRYLGYIVSDVLSRFSETELDRIG
jgi:hypothetical protein